MKFDRRAFFNAFSALGAGSLLSPSVAGEVKRGEALAESVRAEVPLQPDLRVPSPLTCVDRRPCLWFDTFWQSAGDFAPSSTYLFQVALGQYDMRGNIRTRLHTNMLMAGCLPGGVDAVAERVGFLFHPDTSDEDMIQASRWGRWEFLRAEKIIERGALDWAGSGAQRGNPLAREAKFIDIPRTVLPMYMHFYLRLEFERAIEWQDDVRLLCFIDTLTNFPVQ